jgi:magnesium transporter
MDLVETFRELGSDLMDVYLSSVSNRLNEVMKLLTIFTTIFIPLTLISGIYGMNFHTDISPWNMPELRWYWGYPFALLLMALVAIGMLIYFRRRGWLGEPRMREFEMSDSHGPRVLPPPDAKPPAPPPHTPPAR